MKLEQHTGKYSGTVNKDANSPQPSSTPTHTHSRDLCENQEMCPKMFIAAVFVIAIPDNNLM